MPALWTEPQIPPHSLQHPLAPSHLQIHLEVREVHRTVKSFSCVMSNSCIRYTDKITEPADLGQLAAVFEVLRTEFQPRTQPAVIPHSGTPTSSLLVSPSDGDAEEVSLIQWSKSNSTAFSESDDEMDYGEELSETKEGLDQPSLGYLDDVLGFLAAERAKFTAQREAGLRGGLSSQSQASTSESEQRLPKPCTKIGNLFDRLLWHTLPIKIVLCTYRELPSISHHFKRLYSFQAQ